MTGLRTSGVWSLLVGREACEAWTGAPGAVDGRVPSPAHTPQPPPDSRGRASGVAVVLDRGANSPYCVPFFSYLSHAMVRAQLPSSVIGHATDGDKDTRLPFSGLASPYARGERSGIVGREACWKSLWDRLGRLLVPRVCAFTKPHAPAAFGLAGPRVECCSVARPRDRFPVQRLFVLYAMARALSSCVGSQR